MNNTVNDLHHEIKFENCVKNKNNFLTKQNISFLHKNKDFFILEKYIRKISQNSIASTFFLPRQILKNRYALAKASAFADC